LGDGDLQARPGRRGPPDCENIDDDEDDDDDDGGDSDDVHTDLMLMIVYVGESGS
jgi:hypothetical protein